MQKGIALWLDNREHGLAALLDHAEIRPLSLGDVQIVATAVGDDAGPIMIFERKTVADLAASVKDGRYREQAVRLRASGLPPWRVTYIIEGARSLHEVQVGPHHGLGANSLCSAILGMQYRDGFHVQFTPSITATASLIEAIYARLQKDPARWDSAPAPVEGGGETSSYIDCLRVKTERRDNITPDVCFQLQLCQIPGVSTKLAKAIAARYASMAEMVLELHTLGPEEACRALQEVPLLGPKKAATIFAYLCGGI